MNLSVGDIVFVMDKKTQAVVPCQLVERISSITLSGENIRNIVSTPRGKQFVLEEYDSPWFQGFEEAHDYLKNAALSLGDATMKKAKEAAEKSFGISPVASVGEVASTEILKNTEKLEDQDFVDIAGQKVKVTLPKEISGE